VSAASRIAATLFQDCSEVGNFADIQDRRRDECRCGSLKMLLKKYFGPRIKADERDKSFVFDPRSSASSHGRPQADDSV
jgi:hypothetical protein